MEGKTPKIIENVEGTLSLMAELRRNAGQKFLFELR
jgi:hypothetical protein